MANTVKVKRSAVPGKTPATADLELGELAINTHDGKLFLKKNDGTDAIVDVTGGGAPVFSVAGKIGDVTLVKADVGLGNVDNTSDAAKPVSTATQSALNTKVDKVTGKGLSTEDFTSAEKTKLGGIEAGAQVNVGTNLGITGTGNTRTLTSSTGSNVTVPVATASTAGLMATGDKSKLDGIAAGAQVNVATNLGYTAAASAGTVTSSTGSNATLPAATSAAAGLLTSADKSKLDGIAAGAQVNTVISVAGRTGAVALAKADVGLGNVDNTSDAAKPVSTATQTALDAKVDKVTGKGLSTEDFTTAEQTKLAGIAAGAQVNVATNLGITGTGNTRTITSSTGSNVTVPVATTTTAGLMATGDKSKLDGIAAGAQVNVATNLGYTAAASAGTVTSSTGANATLPAATTSAAGLLTSADKSKLNGIAAGAQVNTVTSVAGKTGAVALAVADVSDAVATSRAVNTGTGLTGGGNLTANRTLSVDSTVVRQVGATIDTSATVIELGRGASGDRSSFIDFHSSGNPGAVDFSARIIRDPGVNGGVQLVNAGSGPLIFAPGGATKAVVTSNGSMGIGTSDPVGALDVVNANQRYIFRDGRIDCVNSGNTAWATFVAQGDIVDFRRPNNAITLRQRSDGRIELLSGSASRGASGRPLTTPNDSVANAIRQPGYIEWTTDIGAVGTNYFVSDERKKDNIAPATKLSSEVINAINFIAFDWKPESGNTGHVEVGVSAQQLQTIDTRLVNTLSDGGLMVSEPALVAHIAKALQEALARIDALEARVAALEGAAP